MSGKVIKETLALIQEKIPNLGEIIVKRVCIGLGYTGVKLDTGHVGICYTHQSEIVPRCCHVTERAGTLAGSSAFQLADLARSWDLGESVVGVATLNALSQIILEKGGGKYSIAEGNLIDLIGVNEKDRVALVGDIKPFRESLRGRVKNLHVFERRIASRDRNVLPDVACEEILPNVDVAMITGSSIANKTIDRLLELCEGAREVGVVGASSSIIPDALFRYGATIVGGIKVVDAEKLMQIVAEGGGTRQIKRAVKFINIRRTNVL